MIGPRCSKCKKALHHHHDSRRSGLADKRQLCPAGKRIGGSYQEFHPTDTFQAREPKKRGSSEKRKDRSVRREIKAMPCIVCGAGDCDPAHIRGWLISQCDAPFNITSLCRAHHTQQSNRGWYWMAMRYPSVAQELKSLGWEFIVNESTGDWGMFNPLEVEFQRQRRCV